MAAGTAGDDFKAAAAEGFGDDGVGTGSIDDQAVSDGIAPARRLENVAHAAEIAFAFLANIADENERQCVGKAGSNERGCDREHGGDSGAVVGDSWAVEARALLANIERSGRGKNGIDVRAQRDITIVLARAGGEQAEDVADIVDLDAGEADFAKASGQPLCAQRFTEGRSGHAGDIHLPLRDLRLFKAEAAESRADLGHAREQGYFFLNGWKHFRVRHR